MRCLDGVVDHLLNLVSVFFGYSHQTNDVASGRLNTYVRENQSLFNSHLSYLPEVDCLSPRFPNGVILVLFNPIWPHPDHIWRENSAALKP